MLKAGILQQGITSMEKEIQYLPKYLIFNIYLS